MSGSGAGAIWLVLIGAVLVAVVLWAAAGSDKLESSIDTATDKSLDAAGVALRAARAAGQTVKNVSAEIDRRSK